MHKTSLGAARVDVRFEANGARVEVSDGVHVSEARVQIDGVMRWSTDAREMIRSALSRRAWLHLANYERANPLVIEPRALFEVRNDD
jgi:hypothetical protein